MPLTSKAQIQTSMTFCEPIKNYKRTDQQKKFRHTCTLHTGIQIPIFQYFNTAHRDPNYNKFQPPNSSFALSFPVFIVHATLHTGTQFPIFQRYNWAGHMAPTKSSSKIHMGRSGRCRRPAGRQGRPTDWPVGAEDDSLKPGFVPPPSLPGCSPTAHVDQCELLAGVEPSRLCRGRVAGRLVRRWMLPALLSVVGNRG